jgi:hypothetical protein
VAGLKGEITKLNKTIDAQKQDLENQEKFIRENIWFLRDKYERCFELLKKYVEIGSPIWDEDFAKLENINKETREFIKENS